MLLKRVEENKWRVNENCIEIRDLVTRYFLMDTLCENDVDAHV